MSHFAKYATGRKRIQVGKIDNNNDVYITAYAGDKDITLVILNQGTTPVPSLKINLPVAVKSGVAIETSETQNIINKSVDLSEDKKSAITSLPARSVVSIKFDK